MKFTASLILMTGVLMPALPSFAAPSAVNVWGRVTSYSCVYFTNRDADVAVTYRNDALPWRTRVSVLYGWGGETQRRLEDGRMATVRISWDNPGEVQAEASAPYEWRAWVRGTVASRSSPTRYDQLEFVVRVELPNGHVFYEKGNDSPLGYYWVWVNSSMPDNCVDPGDARRPRMRPLEVKSAKKHR